MAEDRMDVVALLRKAGGDSDTDFLRAGMQALAEALMEAEVTAYSAKGAGEVAGSGRQSRQAAAAGRSGCGRADATCDRSAAALDKKEGRSGGIDRPSSHGIGWHCTAPERSVTSTISLGRCGDIRLFF